MTNVVRDALSRLCVDPKIVRRDDTTIDAITQQLRIEIMVASAKATHLTEVLQWIETNHEKVAAL
jgi:hypothetical protein